eukprot:jgi/Phyca11/131295/e_gw1.103.27.1
MTPSANTQDCTQFELWYNRKPTVQNLKVFGCAAYVHINDIYRDKLDPRAKLCIYLGIPEHKKGYRLMDAKSHSVVYSRDVIFNEIDFPIVENIEVTSGPLQLPDHLTEAPITDVELPACVPLETQTDPSQPESPGDSVVGPQHAPITASNQLPSLGEALERINLSQKLNSREDVQEEEERMSLVLSLLAIRHVPEPKTYYGVMRSSYADKWHATADSEYQSLMKNQTWILVTPPENRKVLQNRWVFVVKYTGSGAIDRFKARFVIKGFLQQYGVDYNEIFAPVTRMEVLRLLLTIAALLDFEIHHMDVKTAFLNGTLDEEIYMKQPEGFVVPGKEGLV